VQVSKICNISKRHPSFDTMGRKRATDAASKDPTPKQKVQGKTKSRVKKGPDGNPFDHAPPPGQMKLTGIVHTRARASQSDTGAHACASEVTIVESDSQDSGKTPIVASSSGVSGRTSTTSTSTSSSTTTRSGKPSAANSEMNVDEKAPVPVPATCL